MIKHIKYSFLLFILITGISFSGSAVAAPVININGNFTYTYNSSNGTGQLNMTGIIAHLNDMPGAGISAGQTISFISNWNGSIFTDAQLLSQVNNVLFEGTATDFDLSLSDIPGVPAEINLSGFYAISAVSGGVLAPYLSPTVEFSLDLTDLLGQPSAAMSEDLSGNFNGRFIATPIPSAWVILASGLMGLAGFRRTQYFSQR